jgi:hypothetical protein
MSSFHGDTVTTTAGELKDICYIFLDSNDGIGKTNFDFKFLLPNGKECWVYDWKKYRPISEYEYIEFNIGADTASDSTLAYEYIHELLKENNDE